MITKGVRNQFIVFFYSKIYLFRYIISYLARIKYFFGNDSYTAILDTDHAFNTVPFVLMKFEHQCLYSCISFAMIHTISKYKMVIFRRHFHEYDKV